MRRVIAYIDGMNLYHGLRDRHGRRLHWLDVQSLAQSMLMTQQSLTRVNYFTARIRNQPSSERRQEAYLSALTAMCPQLLIVEGRYQERRERCRSCGVLRVVYDEKETDVNIAAAIIRDAASDAFDTALLFSADSDLVPAVTTARSLAPGKRFVAMFPPARRSDALRRVCDGAMMVGDAKLRQAQLPEKIRLTDGTVLERPPCWH